MDRLAKEKKMEWRNQGRFGNKSNICTYKHKNNTSLSLSICINTYIHMTQCTKHTYYAWNCLEPVSPLFFCKKAVFSPTLNRASVPLKTRVPWVQGILTIPVCSGLIMCVVGWSPSNLCWLMEILGKILVPLGWYPSCLTPQGAL